MIHRMPDCHSVSKAWMQTTAHTPSLESTQALAAIVFRASQEEEKGLPFVLLCSVFVKCVLSVCYL